VRVEGCTAYISAINDVLNGQSFEALLLDEGKESFPKKMLRPLHTPILPFGHRTSLVSEQFALSEHLSNRRADLVSSLI
jgi:hypothetical protein